MRDVKGIDGLFISGEQQSKKWAIIFLFSDDVWGGQERGTVVTRTLRWAGKIPWYLALFPITLCLSEDGECTELQYFGIFHAALPFFSFPLRGKRMTVTPHHWHDSRIHFSLCIMSLLETLFSNGPYLSWLQLRSIVWRGWHPSWD